MKRMQGAIAFASGLIAVFVLLGPAAADPAVSRAPAGDWVEILEIPQTESRYADRVRGGKAYLMSEFQIRPAEKG